MPRRFYLADAGRAGAIATASIRRVSSRPVSCCKPPRNSKPRKSPGGTKPEGLSDALLYNRRLWTVFLDSPIKEGRGPPAPLHGNLKTLRAFVVCERFSLTPKPQQMHLNNQININRRVAAGLCGRH
jgi:flagellar biosynthesis regulator FlaF